MCRSSDGFSPALYKETIRFINRTKVRKLSGKYNFDYCTALITDSLTVLHTNYISAGHLSQVKHT